MFIQIKHMPIGVDVKFFAILIDSIVKNNVKMSNYVVLCVNVGLLQVQLI